MVLARLDNDFLLFTGDAGVPRFNPVFILTRGEDGGYCLARAR